MKTRYFNLSVDWYESDWLEPLSDSAQLAWVRLLGYCKRDGRAGAVRRLTVQKLARKLSIKGGAEPVAEMLAAGIADGAIEIDEEWDLIRVVKWTEYQDSRSRKKGDVRGCAQKTRAQSTEPIAQTPSYEARCSMGTQSDKTREWWQTLTQAERRRIIADYEQTDVATSFPVRRGDEYRWEAIQQMHIMEMRHAHA